MCSKTLLFSLLILPLVCCSQSEKTKTSLPANDPGTAIGAATDTVAEVKHISIRPLVVGNKIDKATYDAYGEGNLFTVSDVTDSVFAVINGKSYREGCPVSRSQLRYLRMLHVNADGDTLVGDMVCNRQIANRVIDIFRELFHQAYAIEKITLVDNYGADDDASMADNNTSCFNYRSVPSKKVLSLHAYGMAVDINPKYNPYIWKKNGKTIIQPDNGRAYVDRKAANPYMIKAGDPCYEAFVKRGFRWGGHYKSSKDYQHFEKRR